MGRNKKNNQVKRKPIIITILLMVFIYIGIGTSTVSEIRDVLHTGYQDGVVFNPDTRIYEMAGQELKTYPKYRYSVAFGEPNQFNYALDGFSYTDTVGIGRKTFVFEYSWYGGEEFNSREVVNYIDNNYWLMVFRMVVYSNQLVVAMVIFVGLLVLNYWIIPIITHALASMFGLIMAIRGAIAKDGSNKTVRVYEARVLRKTVESYENRSFVYWLAGFIAIAVSLHYTRYHEESAIFVSIWTNITSVIFYILNKIVVNHIKLIKEHKGEDEENGRS